MSRRFRLLLSNESPEELLSRGVKNHLGTYAQTNRQEAAVLQSSKGGSSESEKQVPSKCAGPTRYAHGADAPYERKRSRGWYCQGEDTGSQGRH